VSWIIAAAYATAVAWFVAGLAARQDHVIRVRLGAAGREARAGGGGLVWIGKRLPVPATRRRLDVRLQDVRERFDEADRIIGAKVLLCVSGGLIGLLAWPAGWVPAMLAALTLGCAGNRLPEINLARRAATSRRRVAYGIPSLLDLLAVCVTAGLSPSMALERSVDTARGQLHETRARARREVALGGSWTGAVRDAADRLDIRDLRRLAVTLERGQRLGAPLAEQLRRLARDVRDERRSLAEERARRAPVLMLFPLVFLILPAFVLAAVIPAVLVAARGLP
jgi:pilus assembly protein TadC